MLRLAVFGLSLEDVADLIPSQLFGDAHAMVVILKGEDQKRLEFLNKALSDSRYPASKATYLSWVKLFKEGERNNKFQVEALLAIGYVISCFQAAQRWALQLCFSFCCLISQEKEVGPRARLLRLFICSARQVRV